MHQPSQKILTNYSNILVDFALGGGKGIKKGDVVYLQFDALALPLALEVYKNILKSGGFPMVKMNEEEFSRIYYAEASDDQLEFFPEAYSKALVDTIDHRMYIMAERDPFLLKNIAPEKLMKGQKSRQKMKKWLFDKEDQGKMTWTLCLYGTEGMAAEANLSLPEFWNQIEKACFLDEVDPIAKWKSVQAEIEKTKHKLDALPIQKLHLTAKNTDLWIEMGEQRKWLGGGGRNIPSFELYISPDWRGTQGHISFDLPLYRYGNMIEGVRLEFKDGLVVKATATKNEKLLQELIKQPNANKIGEYSLTDRRFSHITKFMANTLFDENFGGEWGNTHLAIGSSYHDGYTGNLTTMTDDDWAKLGFNESVEHTDIIASSNRTVEATMRDGSKKVIYKDGEFRV